jgi:hypothetical protein
VASSAYLEAHEALRSEQRTKYSRPEALEACGAAYVKEMAESFVLCGNQLNRSSFDQGANLYWGGHGEPPEHGPKGELSYPNPAGLLP